METKMKTLSIVEIVLLAVAFVFNIRGALMSNSIQFIYNLVAIATCLFYSFSGYKKDGSVYFKLVAAFLAAREFIALVVMATQEEIMVVPFVLVLISYSCFLLLCVSLNLGKTKSYVLASIETVACTIICVLDLIYPVTSVAHMMDATRLILAFVFGIMIWAKYVDKDARHTK